MPQKEITVLGKTVKGTEIRYKDGAVYVGEVINHVRLDSLGITESYAVPHGLGIRTYQNEEVYEGNWFDGRKKDGVGIYISPLPKKSLYYGNWVNNKAEGIFIKIEHNGTCELSIRQDGKKKVIKYGKGMEMHLKPLADQGNPYACYAYGEALRENNEDLEAFKYLALAKIHGVEVLLLSLNQEERKIILPQKILEAQWAESSNDLDLITEKLNQVQNTILSVFAQKNLSSPSQNPIDLTNAENLENVKRELDKKFPEIDLALNILSHLILEVGQLISEAEQPRLESTTANGEGIRDNAIHSWLDKAGNYSGEGMESPLIAELNYDEILSDEVLNPPPIMESNMSETPNPSLKNLTEKNLQALQEELNRETAQKPPLTQGRK